MNKIILYKLISKDNKNNQILLVLKKKEYKISIQNKTKNCKKISSNYIKKNKSKNTFKKKIFSNRHN